MILVGIPNLQTMLSKNILATSAAVTEIEQGTRTTYLLNLSTISKILSWLLDIGKFVIKSNATWSNGYLGTECGYNNPEGTCVEDLFY